jgi:4a-hydroxytetrahydrobiopterin dehydratase
MPEKLQDDTIRSRLDDLANWELRAGKLHREFRFDNFVQAFSFMTSVAIEAEKLDHHPEWRNVYNKVTVDLVTHSADGITELDFDLATKMNALATSFD